MVGLGDVVTVDGVRTRIIGIVRGAARVFYVQEIDGARQWRVIGLYPSMSAIKWEPLNEGSDDAR